MLDVSHEIMAAFERDGESRPDHRLVPAIALLIDETSHSETILHVFPDRRALLEIPIHGRGHCIVNFLTAVETRERLRSEAAGVLEEIERLQRHIRRIGMLLSPRAAGTGSKRPAV